MKFIDIKFLRIFIPLVLLALILFLTFGWLGNDVQVAPLHLEDKTVQFPHTDDNNKESLIIKSDQEHYTGDTGSDAYFSITNTSKIDESAILLFYFPGQFIPNRDDPLGTQPATVTSLEQREGDSWRKLEFFSKNIKINDDLLGMAITKRKPIPEDFEIKTGTQIEIKAGQTVYFKSRISFRSTDNGEFWIEALGKNGGYGLLDPTYSGTHFGSKTSTDSAPAWFASGSLDWTHRKKITIDYKKVAGGSNLSNFPVLFSVIDKTLATTANGGKAASGSGEFVFTSSDGTTVLPHEIETYSATTGELISWVNVTTLSATQDTGLYIYYGGPAAGTKTNQRRPETWDSNYKGVWHLPNGLTLTARDSTSNGHNGSISGSIATGGKIDGASFYDGSNDQITLGADSSNLTTLNSGNMTISAWINVTDSLVETFGGRIFDQRSGGAGYLFLISESPQGLRWFQDYSTTALQARSAADAYVLGRWSYVVVTWDGSATATNILFYSNGKRSFNTANVNGSVTKSTGTGAPIIGECVGATCAFSGRIDEVRASNIQRSAAWIETEYNSQNSPSTFYSIGRLEAKVPTNPGLKIKGGVKFK